jgi:hypothetical protein
LGGGVSYHRRLPVLGLLLAACLLLGPRVAGAEQGDWQADPSLALLPHELEEQRELGSRWGGGLTDEQAADLAAQEEAIQEDIRQYEAGLQESERLTGVLPDPTAGRRTTASVRVHPSAEDVEQWEALLRRELVPGLKSLGASDAEIEVMLRDLAQVLSGGGPDW